MAYRLLICEDEPLERELLSQFIIRSGLPIELVGEAKNGLEAIALAVETEPDIVLMDIMMPGIDGLKAATSIREKCDRIKIVVITAYDEFDYAREAIQIGVVDYLLKPVRPDDLIAVIRNIVDALNSERERAVKEIKLRESIKKAAKILQSEFLAGLLYGAFQDEKIIDAQAVLLGIDQIPNAVLVIEPDLETSRAEGELSRYEVYCLVDDLVTSSSKDCIVVLMGEQIVVGVCPPQNPEELAEMLRRSVERTLDYTVTIGIGKTTASCNLTQLFKDVQMTARLGKFFFGGNRIVAVEELDRLLGSVDTPNFEKEEKLVNQVRLGQKTESLKILEEMLQEMVACNRGSVALCQIQLAEVLVLVCRAAKQAGFLDKRNLQLQHDYLQKLGRCQSIADLMRWCSDLLDGIFGSNEERTGKYLVQSVMKYISENYAKQLSLQEIARQIYLSPVYFGRLFKKEAGCTYVEYLTRVRIDVAKQLLATTCLPVSEIAYKVGYSDSNYFSRVFHKAVGLPPKEYRRVLGLGVLGLVPENSRK